MSLAAPAPPRGFGSGNGAVPRCRVNLADEALIPEWVADLPSFRAWAVSDEYPQRGKFSYFRGEIWADLSMEQLFSHNQLKTRLIAALSQWADSRSIGYVFSDGVRLSQPAVELPHRIKYKKLVK